MQSLTPTSKRSSLRPAGDLPSPAAPATAGEAVLDTVPLLLWYVRRHMRRHRKGLSVPQFRVLNKIQDNPDASLSCVAEHLGASLPTASRIVAILVDRGFLARQESRQDRRQMKLTLTPAGRSIVESARRASVAQIDREFSRISTADRSAVQGAMAILHSFVSAAKAGAASCETPPERPAAAPRRAAAREFASPRVDRK